MRMLAVTLLLFCCSHYGWAVEDPLKGPKVSGEMSFEELENEVEVLGDLKAEAYFSKVEQLLSKIDKAIEFRHHVCVGDFSVDEAEDGKKDVAKRRKLSKSEQLQCARDLKELRLDYVNNLFSARKRYLDYLHEERIKKLTSIRDEALSEIKKAK